MSDVAFSQTVTMHDLLTLTDGRNARPFLTSRHFTITSTISPPNRNFPITYYSVHPHSSNSETIITGFGSTTHTGAYLHDIVYQTKDLDYINALTKQIQQLHFLFKKKTDKSYVTIYEYDAPGMYILVNIQKRPELEHSIMLRHIF